MRKDVKAYKSEQKCTKISVICWRKKWGRVLKFITVNKNVLKDPSYFPGEKIPNTNQTFPNNECQYWPNQTKANFNKWQYSPNQTKPNFNKCKYKYSPKWIVSFSSLSSCDTSTSGLYLKNFLRAFLHLLIFFLIGQLSSCTKYLGKNVDKMSNDCHCEGDDTLPNLVKSSMWGRRQVFCQLQRQKQGSFIQAGDSKILECPRKSSAKVFNLVSRAFWNPVGLRHEC